MTLSNASTRKLQNPYVNCTERRLNRDTVEREHAQTAKSLCKVYTEAAQRWYCRTRARANCKVLYACILYAFCMHSVCILHGLCLHFAWKCTGAVPTKTPPRGSAGPKVCRGCVGGVSGLRPSGGEKFWKMLPLRGARGTHTDLLSNLKMDMPQPWYCRTTEIKSNRFTK